MRRGTPPKLRIQLPEGKEVVPSHSEAASVETFNFKESSIKESNSNEQKETAPAKRESVFHSIKRTLSPRFTWIKNNWDWPHFVPVIRGAIAAWLSLLLIIIQGAENIVGQVGSSALNCLTVNLLFRQASLCSWVSSLWHIVGCHLFIIFAVAFLAPPIEPTIGVIERELAILLTASAALTYALICVYFFP